MMNKKNILEENHNEFERGGHYPCQIIEVQILDQTSLDRLETSWTFRFENNEEVTKLFSRRHGFKSLATLSSGFLRKLGYEDYLDTLEHLVEALQDIARQKPYVEIEIWKQWTSPSTMIGHVVKRLDTYAPPLPSSAAQEPELELNEPVEIEFIERAETTTTTNNDEKKKLLTAMRRQKALKRIELYRLCFAPRWHASDEEWKEACARIQLAADEFKKSRPTNYEYE